MLSQFTSALHTCSLPPEAADQLTRACAPGLAGDKQRLEQEIEMAKASTGDFSLALSDARGELAGHAADREFLRSSLESLEKQLEIAEEIRLEQCLRIQQLSGGNSEKFARSFPLPLYCTVCHVLSHFSGRSSFTNSTSRR